MLGLARYEADVCACGFHKSIASDPTNHFTFDLEVCPLCKGRAQYERVLSASDDAARKHLGDKPPPGTPDPADGRHVATRMMHPDEIAERRSLTERLGGERGRS